MIKKALSAPPSWNSGRVVGPKTEFTELQVAKLERILERNQNWHDLVLLTVGVDSMLRASDLLQLRVKDVAYPSGKIRSELRTRQQKTNYEVYPVLNIDARAWLRIWIAKSGKSQDHFLFTRKKEADADPITRGHYARLTKRWADWLELPSEEYSTHSLRRSKPVIMFEAGKPIELISELLGHQSVATTTRYLGINQKKARAAALDHRIFKGPSKDYLQ